MVAWRVGLSEVSGFTTDGGSNLLLAWPGDWAGQLALRDCIPMLAPFMEVEASNFDQQSSKTHTVC